MEEQEVLKIMNKIKIGSTKLEDMRKVHCAGEKLSSIIYSKAKSKFMESLKMKSGNSDIALHSA